MSPTLGQIMYTGIEKLYGRRIYALAQVKHSQTHKTMFQLRVNSTVNKWIKT